MSLTAVQKAEIVGRFQRGQSDTGSTEVQVALLSARITRLTDHLKIKRQDKHSRHGLLKLVSQRKSLLKYLKRTAFERYAALIEGLGIRG
ncbi:MAG TPA: 30S ribosomal protein S15 [Gammaproteobacteria bacterium]|nr:30S ribosomal protein S15 [Gammaproteobacteria bacterium]